MSIPEGVSLICPVLMTNLVEGGLESLYNMYPYMNHIFSFSPQWVSWALWCVWSGGFYPSALEAVRVNFDKLRIYDTYSFYLLLSLLISLWFIIWECWNIISSFLLAVKATSSSLLARIFTVRLTFNNMQFITQIILMGSLAFNLQGYDKW